MTVASTSPSHHDSPLRAGAALAPPALAPSSLAPGDGYLFERLAAELSRMVSAMRPGDRLPSLRSVVKRYGVSLATAELALRRLEGEGLIEARPRSGFFVRQRAEAPPPRMPRRTALAMQPSVAQRVRALIETMRHPEVVPLGGATLSPSLLPVDGLAGVTARVLRAAGAAGVGYDVPPGSLPLRRQIARRMTERGAPTTPDEILTTVGCMEALQLALRLLTQPGDTVAVESPTYYGLLQLLETLSLKAVEIPAHPETGMCLDSLEQVLSTQPVAAVLVNPCYLNPLGALMPDPHKLRLTHLLHRFQTWAIEDDIYGELGHDPDLRPRPLRAFDAERVLYVSSFSKALAPGYRVGWLCPGPFLERALALQFAGIVATPTPTSLAVSAYLEGGAFDRHLRRLRPLLKSQVAQYRDALTAAMPSGTRISSPQGGFVLWVELDGPAGLDTELMRLALERQIAIAPGSIFSARERFSQAIRVNCGHPLEGRFARAIETLGALAHRLG